VKTWQVNASQSPLIFPWSNAVPLLPHM
jgi:hypothetical protein